MDMLRTKIINTELFSDEDKQTMLAHLDTYPQKDREDLESIIDEYDTRHQAILMEFKDHLMSEIDAVERESGGKNPQIKVSLDKVRLGLNQIIPSAAMKATELREIAGE